MPTTITALPTAPSRVRPATFSAETDAFLASLATMVTEENTVIGELNLLADTVASNTASAAADAALAEDFSQATAAISGATIYSGATTYDFPDTVICTDGNTYRCIGSTVVGDNPVGSVTGDWVRLTTQIEGYVSFQSLFNGGR